MVEAIVVQTTTASKTEADAIASALLAEGLAACVQISAIRSRYIWQGEVRRDDEELLLIKTSADLWERVRARIRELHSYDLPEILAAPVTAVDADYAAWLTTVTARPSR
ncbi:divalent-cation tolerance protein CutA [Phenylobacterium sp.]|uniref:divalent-cation tolerance protein CutA n=1 Tax=Phenylobacterium sp. TaxID=1871053 RepID=UPI0035AE5ECD